MLPPVPAMGMLGALESHRQSSWHLPWHRPDPHLGLPLYACVNAALWPFREPSSASWTPWEAGSPNSLMPLLVPLTQTLPFNS